MSRIDLQKIGKALFVNHLQGDNQGVVRFTQYRLSKLVEGVPTCILHNDAAEPVQVREPGQAAVPVGRGGVYPRCFNVSPKLGISGQYVAGRFEYLAARICRARHCGAQNSREVLLVGREPIVALNAGFNNVYVRRQRTIEESFRGNIVLARWLCHQHRTAVKAGALVAVDMREVKTRLTGVELGQAAVRREIAVLAEADAHLGARVDRLTDRIERVERRLDLAPAA